MKPIHLVAYIYAFLLIAGGSIGLIVSGSIVSVLAGAICGGLVLFGSAVDRQHIFWGLPFLLVVTFFLGLFFTYRFYLTQNWMPGGLMMVVSGFVFIQQGYELYRRQ